MSMFILDRAGSVDVPPDMFVFCLWRAEAVLDYVEVHVWYIT